MVNIVNVICQNTDNVIISTCSPSIIYPLISDKNIEKYKETRMNCHFDYPLLILNGIIFREEEKVNCFRNRFDLANIKKIKRISQKEAEKKGISNVPNDGVLFVTIKKGYYFDFSCE